jgi:hypothetical protein
LVAAGIVKVVEQTWRLDPDGPTGNSSARIGEKPRIDPGAVQQGREGEAWYVARGRHEHLMVARTQISDAWRARARAIVALARSWRPEEALPGAMAWRDAEQAASGALAGLVGHLAIEPPPAHRGSEDGGPDDGGPLPDRQAWPDRGPGGRPAGVMAEPAPPHGPAAAVGYRLRLAVAAAARDGDRETVQALLTDAARRDLSTAELLAVAERHWPAPALPRRLTRAGRRWTAAQVRRAMRHLRHRHVAGRAAPPRPRP